MNKCASLGALVSMGRYTFGPNELVGRYLAEPMLSSTLPNGQSRFILDGLYGIYIYMYIYISIYIGMC